VAGFVNPIGGTLTTTPGSALCVGSSCLNIRDVLADTDVYKTVQTVQNVAMHLFDLVEQAVSSYSPQLSVCFGGLFLASGLNNLARPKAGGVYVVGNFAISLLFATYAYNREAQNLAMLSQLFLGSALAMAFQRIKSLENQYLLAQEALRNLG
jgi:hypothetical protein